MVSWYLLFKHIFLMTAISLSLSLFLCFPLCPHTHAQTHARNYICMLLFPGSRWILMSCSGCCVVTVSIMNINLFYLKTLLCCGFIFHKYIMTLPMCCAHFYSSKSLISSVFGVMRATSEAKEVCQCAPLPAVVEHLPAENNKVTDVSC